MTEHLSVAWCTSVESARWIAPRLHPFGQDAGAVIPTGFDAYVRLLHPARRWDATGAVNVRWGDVAGWSGHTIHPQVQFPAISECVGAHGERRIWDGEPPRDGALPFDEALALTEVLADYTTTPDRCWFCLWDGYGWNPGSMATLTAVDEGIAGAFPWPAVIPESVIAGPRVRLPGRDYFLYRGPLADATAFCFFPYDQTPNLWWPDDRAWCVTSEIDLCWTYVGGSARLIDRILADHRFEALPACLTDAIAHDSDTLNR